MGQKEKNAVIEVTSRIYSYYDCIDNIHYRRHPGLKHGFWLLNRVGFVLFVRSVPRGYPHIPLVALRSLQQRSTCTTIPLALAFSTGYVAVGFGGE